MPGSRKTATAASTTKGTRTSIPTAAASTVPPETVEGWLRGLGLEPLASVERDGISAWDVALDGRRRRDLRTTVILDPAIGAIVWAHLAPPLGDGLRKAYRTLLRWNDEFPLAKFSVADDGRPILAVELPTRWLDSGELGLALARVAVIADAIFDETRGWLWIGGRVPDGYDARPIRTAALLEAFADRLGELGRLGDAVTDPIEDIGEDPWQGMRLPRRLGPIRGFVFGIALATALGLCTAVQPSAVAAAAPGLTITSDATYEVLPEEGRVAVTVHLTATNHLKNTVARHYFFGSAFLTVQPGTSGYRLTGGSGTPSVAVHEIADTFTSLKLDFGTNVAAGKSIKLTLAFDLLDAGGEPDRPLRVSPSLVTFGAWAFATPSTPGSTVNVVFPSGYRVTIGRGPLEGPTPDEAGHDDWFSGAIEAPLDFVADVVADRPAAYAETPVDVALSAGAASVTVRAWPDDPAWADRVTNLVENALPILERQIGVAWPVNGPLLVNEVLVRGSGGYAGVFDPAERRIDISYAASDTVVIHELAHAWFNGRIVADRWAAEAFASYYADVTTRELGLNIQPVDPVEPGVGAIPLNAWGSSETSDPATDLYAYAASLQLARDIAERAGPDALRAVWLKAGRGVGAYQPDATAQEPVSGAPDWRGLLDLQEDQTGQDFGDLWRAWVARPEDLTAMDARTVARTTYRRTVEAAGEWRLPRSIRDAMRTWRFDVAADQLDAANGILLQRAELTLAATAVDVTLPDTLRTAFEGTAGLPAAAAEASAELSAVEMIAAAASAQAGSNGLLDDLESRIGLVGRDPDRELGAARLALQSGNAADATEAARHALEAWQGAAEAGRARIVSAAMLAVALAIFAGLVRAGRRRRPAEAT